ncbi:ribosomal protein L11 [Rozella allomycis CSF55]|uniref:Ribosomal protein L11 n=1 Tax=Rozella allomycis (strain CSF55) TaxID=988480 RepID=A0A075AW00_ROZAC|nr:Ribosomal protein L11 domain-containing protein [Rozella allomycis CSF55]RKP19213.1 ribosomal protein L11 [Rozella allomycis CSF55]|eukprot:EPZ32694.1 Ribosomal protein L11 domain-containing protein [Rozella allomycis CSF55]
MPKYFSPLGKQPDLISGFVRFRVPAGQASVGPPLGPVLGARGIKAMDFCKIFNEKTKMYTPGIPMRIDMKIYKDRSYRYEIKSPDLSWFFKRCTGSSKFHIGKDIECNGVITMRHIYEIAKLKENEPHYMQYSLQAICKNMLSRARAYKLKVIP